MTAAAVWLTVLLLFVALVAFGVMFVASADPEGRGAKAANVAYVVMCVCVVFIFVTWIVYAAHFR